MSQRSCSNCAHREKPHDVEPCSRCVHNDSAAAFPAGNNWAPRLAASCVPGGDPAPAPPPPPFSPAASAARKGMPLFSGCLMYFPDALLAVAEHSRKANDKHNPGEPLHWSKDKSKDHADCIGRHLVDIGPQWDAVDPEFGSYHATALAWRALALLQTVIERERAKEAA